MWVSIDIYIHTHIYVHTGICICTYLCIFITRANKGESNVIVKCLDQDENKKQN